MSDFLTLIEQRSRLEKYDENYWDRRMQQAIAELDISTRHVQRADDLEILHVDFGSPKATVEAWWDVIKSEYPNVWRSPNLQLDPGHFSVGLQAAHYSEGVHPVRINLTSFWDPKHGRKPAEVFEEADNQGKTMAQGEVLSLFGVHRELAPSLNGRDLPKLDMMGYQASSVDEMEPWQGVLCMGWDAPRKRLELSTRLRHNPVYGWGVPTIID